MKRFSNILFFAEPNIDNSAAFGQAFTLANNNQAQLTVISVIDDVSDGALRNALIAQRQDELRELLGRAGASSSVEIKILAGHSFTKIIREVLQQRYDLLIKSISKSKSIGQRLFGGNDLKLLRKSPCPVWLIQSTQQQGYQQVLVALDFEPENPENEPLNRQLLEMASSLALSEFSELHVIHAWHLQHESLLRSARLGLSKAEVDEMLEQEERERREWLTAIVDDCCRAQGQGASDYLQPQIHLVNGYPQEAVPVYARDIGAELVVMGTVGRTGIPGFVIGNTAEEILQEIDCSVLAVKPSGFKSPITIEPSQEQL